MLGYRHESPAGSSKTEPKLLIVDNEGNVQWQKVDHHKEISQAALGRHARQNVKWEGGHVHDRYYICMVRRVNGVQQPTALYEVVFEDFAASIRGFYNTDTKFQSLVDKWPQAVGALEGATKEDRVAFQASVKSVVQNWIHNSRSEALKYAKSLKADFEGEVVACLHHTDYSCSATSMMPR